MVVLVAVTSAPGAALLASDVAVTIVAGVFFAGVVGVSLSLLAFRPTTWRSRSRRRFAGRTRGTSGKFR